METNNASKSKIHITECSWTDRTSHPHRRCRVEIDETTARCWRNSENGYQLVAELKRPDADAEFDASSLPEIFAWTVQDLAECEQKARRGEPIGEEYVEDETERETFDDRCERILEELGPCKTPYYNCMRGELTEAELIVNIAEHSAEGSRLQQTGPEPGLPWSDDDTSIITWELGREPTADELEMAKQAHRARAADLWARLSASRARRAALKEGRAS